MRRVGKVTVSDYAISWAIFLTLTPVLCLLRYVDLLSPGDLENLIFGGQIAFAVFYLVIVIEAFTEDIFDGILCFFLPPYTFFYLFFKSTSFVLRAVIVALTAAFGKDIAVASYEYIIQLIKEVADWIEFGAIGK